MGKNGFSPSLSTVAPQCSSVNSSNFSSFDLLYLFRHQRKWDQRHRFLRPKLFHFSLKCHCLLNPSSSFSTAKPLCESCKCNSHYLAFDYFLHHDIAPSKEFRNPGNFYSWKIRNPRNFSWGIRNPTKDWKPECKFHWQRIQNPVDWIRNPRRGVHNPRLSWISWHPVKNSLCEFQRTKSGAGLLDTYLAGKGVRLFSPLSLPKTHVSTRVHSPLRFWIKCFLIQDRVCQLTPARQLQTTLLYYYYRVKAQCGGVTFLLTF